MARSGLPRVGPTGSCEHCSSKESLDGSRPSPTRACSLNSCFTRIRTCRSLGLKRCTRATPRRTSAPSSRWRQFNGVTSTSPATPFVGEPVACAPPRPPAPLCRWTLRRRYRMRHSLPFPRFRRSSKSPRWRVRRRSPSPRLRQGPRFRPTVLRRPPPARGHDRRTAERDDGALARRGRSRRGCV
jgi:hypothetical protein